MVLVNSPIPTRTPGQTYNMVAAGTLRHVVTIQSPPDGSQQNESGAVIGDWVDVATIRASITPVGAREIEIARGFADTAAHRVIIRYRAGINTTQRLEFGNRYFYINGVVNPGEENIILELYCSEGE